MIKTESLTKRFGERTAVDDVSFLVEPGTVTGFLGANGAGKTTTLRMLTGLSEPDGGEAVVLGGRYRDLPNPGRRVGVLLDAAAQHGGRRGREALAISAQLMGSSRSVSMPCSTSSASTARPRGSACATIRSACASGWASPTHCSAIRKCSFSTSRRTASIRRGFAGCASCCAISPTAAARSCCPRTCCTRCRRSPTAS